ncbi:AT-rich interactive domain-containing protein 4 [Sesamum angolense]|uniref:AT-rich interactive domain-containing protein 4 n=1 Tax=Sesamum angolense TaxID=2727404 RepID=A0AAE2BRD2_9LAMI|nr:AT-rich interactive domain-containing protein 4 [Sesamum angolense]
MYGAAENKQKQDVLEEKRKFPFPEIVSSGRLEVQSLKNPTTDEFRKVLDSWQPNLVYLQGEQLPNDEVGSVVWGGLELSSPEAVSGLFSSTMPTTVYLEVPNGERLAESLHSKGVPYVIYWKNSFSCYAASHFVMHCSPQCKGPNLLGESPKINIDIPEMEDPGDDEESSSGSLPAIKIYDDDVNMRFLVCGETSSLDACLLSSLEDGLNALLNIEVTSSNSS